MRAKDDGVLGFERDECLVDGGGGGVCGRNHGGDDADWRGDFDDSLFAVFADYADGADVANGARNVNRGEAILCDFVGDVAVAGFFDGEAGERFASFGGGIGAGFDDGVNLLLGECGELLLGFVGPLDGVAGLLDGNQVAIAQAQRPASGLPALTAEILRFGQNDRRAFERRFANMTTYAALTSYARGRRRAECLRLVRAGA